MKHALHWAKMHTSDPEDLSVLAQMIEQVQIEAWKEGMEDAAMIGRNLNDGHEWPITREIAKAIKTRYAATKRP